MKNRLLAMLLLVVFLLIPVMTACQSGDDSTQPKDTSDGANTADTDYVEKVVLPEDMYYDGEDFIVLTAGNVAYNDFNFTEDTAGVNVVSEAQYLRLKYFEEKYGVAITEERKQYGSSYGDGPGFKSISTSVQSETVSYHLGIIGGYDVANLARNNFLHDLNSLPYVDTSKSWWDQNANNDLDINGLLLFTNGSLTAAYSESTFVMLFNKELAKSHFTEGQDPYQDVKDMKWTIDRLGELSRLVSDDLNGDSVMDYNDQFGIYTWDDSMIGMVEAAGSKICTIDDEGTVTLTLYNDKTVNMINKYAEFAYNGQYALGYQAYIRAGRLTADGVYAAWGENKALFWASSTNNIPRIRSMDSDFGILPYPMLSEDQGRYYTTIAPYNSQFICVPLYQEDYEFVGSVTEALAYHGKEMITPAVYEKTLKGIYARDEESYDMLDIIFGSYGYDFGLYYRIGMYADGLLNLLRNKSNAITSVYQQSEKAANAELATLNAHFESLIDYWNTQKNEQ